MLIFALGNTPAPKTNHAPTCNYKTPLSQGVPGSPGHLIQLPQREPGVTELAAVMRKMYDAMKADKSAIITGKKRPEYPSFNRISCSWPTDMATRSPTFDAMAGSTFAALRKHEAQPTKSSFNALVDTCVSCHRAMCPGPVAALKGLYFKSISAHPAQTEPAQCDPP